MKLEWLRSFAAFAERRNFTHAAEALHVSQPALHVQIHKLAEALGVPLYRKVGRELVLTVEGEKLAAFAREIEERSAEFIDELATGSSRRRVVLCAGEGAFLYLLGPTIRSFTKKEPTALELMTADAAGTLDAVRSGKAHIGVPVSRKGAARPHDRAHDGSASHDRFSEEPPVIQKAEARARGSR